MRFQCTSCDARYNIDKSKIPEGKVMRIACKNCKQVIRVRRGGIVEGAVMIEEKPAQSAQKTSTRWFLMIDKQRQGPFLETELKEKFSQGIITAKTYIWSKGMEKWQRIEKIPEILKAIGAEKEIQTVHKDQRTSKPSPQEKNVERSFAQGVTGELDSSLMSAMLGEPTGESISRDMDEKGSPFEGDLKPQVTPEKLVQTFAPPAVDVEIAPPPMAEISQPKVETVKSTSGLDNNDDYLQAPPGESTRIFMATAGIYKRRRQHKVAAILAGIFVAFLATFITLDVTGMIELPGMGMVYDMTGFQDPNAQRAVKRISTKLESTKLDPEERAKLRAKLSKYGFGDPNAKPKRRNKVATSKPESKTEEYHEAFAKPEKGEKSVETDLLAAMYKDKRKKEKKISLQNLGNNVSVSDLPAGLTRKAITKVIKDSKRSLSLCTAEAAKVGEKVSGKMEVEFTIHGSGKVTEAKIASVKFKGTRMAQCVTKTVKRWAFPRFNGEPVTVVYPIIVSLGI